MSQVPELHAAVRRGDVDAIAALLAKNPALANARSETDPRGTYPLHVAAEFGQAQAVEALLAYGADVSRLDSENDAIAAGSDAAQRNKHGLTPLDCALGGAQGQWQRFSNASLEDWQRCVELLRQS